MRPDAVRYVGAIGNSVGPGAPHFYIEFVENLASRDISRASTEIGKSAGQMFLVHVY